MADIHDVTVADDAAEQFILQLDEEAPLEKIVTIGFIAVAYSIRAVGVRLDYVIRDVGQRFYNGAFGGR